MMPRPVQCDDDRCDYDDTGRWVHHPSCWAVEEAERDAWIEDAALSVAREDGYARIPRPRTATVTELPRQQERRTA